MFEASMRRDLYQKIIEIVNGVPLDNESKALVLYKAYREAQDVADLAVTQEIKTAKETIAKKEKENKDVD